MVKKYKIFDDNLQLIKEINTLPKQMFIRWLTIFLFCSIFPFLAGYYISKSKYNQECIVTEKEYVVLTGHKSKPTEKGVKQAIKDLNIKFPHIVFAQIVCESSGKNGKLFSSGIAIENDNLFGMKFAMSRIRTAKGVQNNHAYYDSWYDSILDYAFWQATYASKVKDEEEYLDLICSVYNTAAPNYRNTIKSIAEKHRSSFKN